MELDKTSTLATRSNWQKNWIFLIIGLFLIIFFIYTKLQKNHFNIIQLKQTVGLQSNSDFQFTLSPDNRWILYYENNFSYSSESGSYGWVAFDTVNQKKFYIDINDTGFSNMLRMNMRNNCWSEDSKYCLLATDKSTAIDFTDTANPVLSNGQFNNINRLTCSDCDSSVLNEKVFSSNTHGSEHASPNGRFIAQQISRGNGWVTPPSLYIIDTVDGKKYFISKNVYYDIHFTSDSQGLYYYGCKNGGACGSSEDSLFFVDLSK